MLAVEYKREKFMNLMFTVYVLTWVYMRIILTIILILILIFMT